MKHLLLLFAEEKTGLAIPPEQMGQVMAAMGAYQEALEKADAFVMASPLARTADARTLRVEGGAVAFKDGAFLNEGGELKVHDGPFAETREQLGGFYIIDVPDMAKALEWGARCPAAQWGSIEVRAMVPGRPESFAS